MDKDISKTARQILSRYSEDDLHKLFGMYGGVRNAKTLAATIVRERAASEFKTIDDLLAVLKPLAPRGRENKYFAQVFQALRIEVNDEINALKEMLERVPKVLKPGGRVVVISYHSLEDRIVKNFFNKGKFSGEPEKDFYGNLIRPLRPLTRKPVVPGEEEISANRRARSAKMRIAEKPEPHA
jgi:16S rRNA (cytosine1402-N4)-methyltransferase